MQINLGSMETKYLLAGDIGGTKTHLALCESGKKIKEKKYPSQDFKTLEEIVKDFLSDVKAPIGKACFGIAGPIKDQKVIATNIPWVIESTRLQKELSIEKVVLINDLEANAYGIKTLSDDEFFVLNKGDSNARGNQALISAGTGLGEAGLYYNGKEHFPFASEGGHSDFAPRNDREIKLLKYLQSKFNHVSYERALSGYGLYNLFSYLVDVEKELVPKEILDTIDQKKGPKIISQKGLQEKGSIFEKTLDWFVSLYGAEASNMALKMMAIGGLYIGGGIAPKILDKMTSGIFMKAFLQKGRFEELLSKIPIKIILNENTALLGAIDYAQNHM